MLTLRAPLRRSLRVRSAIVLASLATSCAFVGCSSDSAPPDGTSGPRPPAIGGDRTQNAAISVDEGAIAATVDGATLHLSIPVRARTTARSAGSLRVAIRTVDDERESAGTTVAYEVGALASTKLAVDLPLPDGVSQQADLVAWNLRVGDGDPTGIDIRRSLLHVVPRYEVVLEGASKATKGRATHVRVRTDDPIGKGAIGGVPVTLRISRGGTQIASQQATTGASGAAVFEVAPDEAGTLTLSAAASAHGTQVEAEAALTVSDVGPKVLLTTDKPLYQPGQTIHLRTLSLADHTNAPVSGAPVLVEVLDGKGNKIVKRTLATDAWGIAATDVQLASVLNQGTFKIQVTENATHAEKTVEVKPYALPKFKAAISTDQPFYRPGQVVTGVVQADYFFGKHVAGADVSIQAATLDVGETVFQTIAGKADASGRFEFQVTLPSTLAGLPIDHGNAVVTLHATLTDAAGQQIEQTRTISVARDALDVAVVPESTSIVPGVENRVDVFVSDPTGTYVAGAEVRLDVDGAAASGSTDAWGHVQLAFTPSAGSGYANASATVTPPGGAPVQKQLTLAVQPGAEHLILRTDRAVYQVGDTVSVDVLATAGTSRVFVDWLNEGQTMDMRSLEVAGGKASYTLTLDETLAGSNRLEAYLVDAQGNIARTGRTVFVRKPGGLSVDLATDRASYAPGEDAKLTFSVKDEQGKPAVAALGVQIVDQAVFALVDAQPGLLRTYFELNGDFATPRYELEGPRADLADLLFTQTASADAKTAEAAQARTAASFAALGDAAPTGIASASWPSVLQRSATLLQPHYDRERQRTLVALQVIARAVEAQLAAQGCDPNAYMCDALGKSYSQSVLEGLLGAAAVYDFWGNRWSSGSVDPWSWQLQLRSAGPDETAGSPDDATMTFRFDELGLQLPYANGADGQGPQPGAGGGFADAGAVPAGEKDDEASGGAPRVRKDFPETLYVAPAIITGPDGKATVDVAMADSITEWRVSSLAHSAAGKLGAGVHGITVFQDFFVDVAFPASLTRGDVVKFPIAVYNYLTTPQTVKLELQADDWYTPLGATSVSVDLEPGEVTGVGFPVRVDGVGLRTLVVQAKGTQASDAVARTVRVVPDGKPVASTWSGALDPGSIEQTVSIPAHAVPGSPRLAVSVYPAFLSQAVHGMDSMLQVPSGCFEQTTSTTWPNVLVTRYMRQTHQITTEIEMKADSLISAGYQRLLTFEHQTGGYSWFGEQDAAANISVTAFGVLEFVDMAEVATVDEAMLARTVQWLASKQSADGSWQGEQTEFFDFSTGAARNTAFVVAALASAGWKGPELAKGIAYLKAQLGASPDAYTLALAANAAVAAIPGDPWTAELLARLDAAKTTDGDAVYWDSSGGQTSFYGTGVDASVTTTGIAAYAMLQANAHPISAQGALRWLVGQRDSFGNYGSSQATVWALRAMILAATKGTKAAVGSFAVEVDGAPAGTVALTQAQADVTSTIDLGSVATPGDHRVKLTFVGTGTPSWDLVAGWNVPWADVADPPGPLTIGVAYDKTQLAVNDTVGVTVTIGNGGTVAQHMALVTVGIPPGFEVVGEDFSDELAAGTLSKFETTGRQLILYVPLVAPSASLQLAYRLRATMPVTADDGGGEVHPYYEPTARTTTASQKLTVTEAP